jgi:hypothetical protein
MPIRPELRHFYRTPEYKAARERVVKRAGNRCEQCGKPNHRRVWVYSSKACGQYWTAVKGDGQKWTYCFTGESGGFKLFGRQWEQVRRIRVVLTVAHLNHTPGDDRDENLKLLCCWCHLNYDKLHHRETRRTRKDAARPMQWQGEIAL